MKRVPFDLDSKNWPVVKTANSLPDVHREHIFRRVTEARPVFKIAKIGCLISAESSFVFLPVFTTVRPVVRTANSGCLIFAESSSAFFPVLVEVTLVGELPGAVLAVEALDLVVAVHVARVVVPEGEPHAADVAAEPRFVHVAFPDVAGQVVRVGVLGAALAASPHLGLRVLQRGWRATRMPRIV